MAFQLTLTVHFMTESGGTIEFKYRKDSFKTYYTNGEFKFYIDDERVFGDINPANNDW